ncbi:MAG TPA: bifunctional demethylmenaquinone methyltransferase/2-methoxy-6-polyprenyl-1,4-benzoquinol methylase UbiE [Xanthomonadales bacterium]|nr:bifunctional demethylmenaquinone methyltransferase/2-methoxy-6-polyprenyl-1,4-benzoquinol methylase UbiE [Xanthomonadales bacterium]
MANTKAPGRSESQPAETPAAKTHFGYREVSTQEKTHLVREVFSSVAGKYDVMNDMMSLGIHRLWKRDFAASSGIRLGQQVLDLAGGTGDISALLSKRVGARGRVVLTDINEDMLEVGRQRMEDRGICGNIDYALVNAEQLPFTDRQFDAVTIAFGLRNVTDKDAALRETFRVLRPGGRVLILEFSRVRSETLQKAYDRYSFDVLPLLGRLVANDAESYRYLAESIRQHPPQEELAAMMQKAGFDQVRFRDLSGGIVAIHSGLHA